MTQDKPLLGVLLMLGFCALAPMGDAIAKLLGGSVPLIQLLLVRFAIQAILLLPIVAYWVQQAKQDPQVKSPLALTPRVMQLTVIRTVLHIVGVGAMFLSLRYLPLADAVAIAFVMPFIMLLLGHTVLGEEVGSRRLIACAICFIGTLLVIQPSFEEVGLPALLPLVVAVDFAFFMLVTRQVAKDIDPIVLQAVSGSIATCMLGGAALILWGTGWLPAPFVLPGRFDITLLAAVGIVGTVAHLLMTWSLRYAPSATLAPMQYLEIPIATVIGYLVFQDLPNGLAALGIAITIGSGLYIVFREHAVSRKVDNSNLREHAAE
ncbi:MAG: DMT family transporter [Pseudomonadota bacterium]